MNILTFSSLYPNAVDPSNGIFVERRLQKLLNHSGDKATVVSPVPWFPFKNPIFGRYAAQAAVPAADRRNDVDVRYPRYLRLPKVGMLLAPLAMAFSALRAIRRLAKTHGPFDVLDAHYLYPDGVAAGYLAARLDLPLLLTARGSDVNVIAQMPGPRRRILAAIRRADAVVAVSDALGEELRKLGVESEKIHVLRNGVDLDEFYPGDAEAVRQALGVEGSLMLSVGTLREAKGHDLAIAALEQLPDVTLAIAGEGEFEQALKAQAERLGVASRVRFLGRVSPTELRCWYQASDALVLMSRREGMPNVVLESLASGTPVIAADVGGIGEVVVNGETGILLRDRTTAALVGAWRTLDDQPPSTEQIRRSAEQLSWDDTIGRLHRLMAARPDAAARSNHQFTH